MKKLLLFIVAIIVTVGAANAQDLKSMAKFEEGKNAIGLRFGAGLAELSYQKYLSDVNRAEIDLGFGFSSKMISITGTYQWVFDVTIAGLDFNWYAGLGANVGYAASKLYLGVVGQVGIEYHFDIPISLSLDYRPMFNILPSMDFAADGIALSVRYRF